MKTILAILGAAITFAVGQAVFGIDPTLQEVLLTMGAWFVGEVIGTLWEEFRE